MMHWPVSDDGWLRSGQFISDGVRRSVTSALRSNGSGHCWREEARCFIGLINIASRFRVAAQSTSTSGRKMSPSSSALSCVLRGTKRDVRATVPFLVSECCQRERLAQLACISNDFFYFMEARSHQRPAVFAE